jgi:hypothetical protein
MICGAFEDVKEAGHIFWWGFEKLPLSARISNTS